MSGLSESIASAMFQPVCATYFAVRIKQCCRPDERQTRGLGRKPRGQLGQTATTSVCASTSDGQSARPKQICLNGKLDMTLLYGKNNNGKNNKDDKSLLHSY